MVDIDGFWAVPAAVGGYVASSYITGSANIWNPVGWAIIGVTTVVSITVITCVIVDEFSSRSTSISESSSYDPDPYKRPGQKQQGRENKYKSRTKEGWKPNPNKKPKPLKKHTPGKDHRKYKKFEIFDHVVSIFKSIFR